MRPAARCRGPRSPTRRGLARPGRGGAQLDGGPTQPVADGRGRQPQLVGDDPVPVTTCSFEERSTDGLDGVPPTRQCRQRHQHMRPPAARADPPARPGADVVPVLVANHPGAGVPPRGQASGTGARQPPAKQVELDLVLVQRDDHIRFFLPCRQSQRSRALGKGPTRVGDHDRRRQRSQDNASARHPFPGQPANANDNPMITKDVQRS